MNDTLVFKDGELELKISVNDETIWLNQKQISELFNVTKQNISLHIASIYKEKELDIVSTVKKYLTVQKEGKREVQRSIEHYNLDMIISIGYRVNSKLATNFRQWATTVLKNYIQDGYTINAHKINEQRLLSLENDITNIKSHINNNSLKIKEGIFFNGEIFDAYVFISNLIKSSKVSIVLIDNYIDESILTLLSKNVNTSITIYTQTVSKQLKLDIEKYNKQYNNLEVKTTKKYHDRFIIIDNKDVYHIGASLKDLGNKVFAFSKMDISSNNVLKNND